MALSQIPDPGVFGIQEEPERVMFYGGSGLLAGFAGLVALISGIYLGANRAEAFSTTQRRFMLGITLVVIIAVLTAIAFRVSPM